MDRSVDPASRRPLAELQVGQELQGTVTKVELFGAFVDVGAERDGLVHISNLRKERVNRVEDVVSPGQSVAVWVSKVDPASGRVELTMVRPVLLKWAEIKSGLRTQGTVVKIEKFGAFVDIGAERPGLVHVSEMSNEYVTNPAQIAKEGDTVCRDRPGGRPHQAPNPADDEAGTRGDRGRARRAGRGHSVGDGIRAAAGDGGFRACG